MPYREPLHTGVKQVLYGAWDGTKKVIESQGPGAWKRRILEAVEKVAPKLNSKQRQWLIDHHVGIEEAATYAAVGVTTAEVFGAAVAGQKLLELLKTTLADRNLKRIEVDLPKPPKQLAQYLTSVGGAVTDRTGAKPIEIAGLTAILSTIMANVHNPDYSPLFRDITRVSDDASRTDLGNGMKQLFIRAHADASKKHHWGSRAADGAKLYDLWVQADAPGMKRILRASDVPLGRAKHITGLMRADLHPDISSIGPKISDGAVSPKESPGFNFVLEKMHTTPPPLEAYEAMRAAVRVLSQDRGALSQKNRRGLMRRVAEVWVDHAMPNFVKRPEARQAFLDQLEREGFPGLPRATAQGLQEFLASEYLPVSKAERVIMRLKQQLPDIFEEQKDFGQATQKGILPLRRRLKESPRTATTSLEGIAARNEEDDARQSQSIRDKALFLEKRASQKAKQKSNLSPNFGQQIKEVHIDVSTKPVILPPQDRILDSMNRTIQTNAKHARQELKRKAREAERTNPSHAREPETKKES